VVAALAAAAPLIALVIYLVIGSPQTPDQPFAGRLKAWRADTSRLEPPEWVAVLQQIASENPGAPAPLVALAHAEVDSGDPAAAERSLRKALTLDPKSAQLWLLLGVTLDMQASDGVSPDARAAYERANALDPSMPDPRYDIGRDEIASGDVRGGLAVWRALSASLPASDPGRAELERRIATAEKTGAIDSGQTDQPPVDQQALIRGMVAQLAARLKAQPDDPQGWGRLIRSYAVLGDDKARQAALASAQAEFKDRPDAWRAVQNAEAAPQ
jgi:cytochrome c-type biogenesis protein CcmH